MSNVVQFPRMFDSDSPIGIAESLLEYVKDKPNCKLVVIAETEFADSDGAGELTMGWTKMNMDKLAFMLRFADYKFEQHAFKGPGSLYVDAD